MKNEQRNSKVNDIFVQNVKKQVIPTSQGIVISVVSSLVYVCVCA